ncbi:MAG TPA: PQQ-dependent sugar dehydrogenase [Ilumatobacteraceae bacterium]|nr:PQQ-dependent sugar dehydrogenase [Ilumatobacteraceae bacterium]
MDTVGDTTADSAGTTTTTTLPLTEGSVVLTSVRDGFERPVDVAWRPGDDAPYVVEQAGLISVERDGGRVEVLDLTDLTSGDDEQGLLGLAFHPEEPFAYVNYTDLDGNTVIAEYPVGADGGFDAGAVRIVLTIEQPYANHNGGCIRFGPDGYLYIGMGDGGSGGDPRRYALNVSTLLGKLLRIDPRPSGDAPYGVPPDNPFIGVGGARPEIWSIGLRNPWRFSFDNLTGDLWIGDVGQGDWEEIDVVAAGDGAGRGANFGWSAFEGTHRYNDDQSGDGVTMPVFEYDHDGSGCSVSGGVVAHGSGIASLEGWYLFGDWCSGALSALRLGANGPEVVALLEIGPISSINAGPDGAVYVLDHGDGALLRLAPA